MVATCLLLEHKANPSREDTSGHSATEIARGSSNNDVVKVLSALCPKELSPAKACPSSKLSDTPEKLDPDLEGGSKSRWFGGFFAKGPFCCE